MKLYIVQMSFVTVHVQQPPLSMCHGDKANNALPTAIGSLIGPASHSCPITAQCGVADANGGPQDCHSYPALAMG